MRLDCTCTAAGLLSSLAWLATVCRALPRDIQFTTDGASPRKLLFTTDGRHVCMTEKMVEVPVKRTETYCKPQHQKHRHLCNRNGSYRMCTSFRVIYKLAYRDVMHTELHTKMAYSCCPGWAQYRPTDKACLKPICEELCQKGGVCVAPNKCKCAKGWRGKQCHKDIDECDEKTDRCSQRCINTPGGYKCACDDGFTLNADRSSCKLCLSCLPEYTEMTTGYKELTNKFIKLEAEKELLKNDINTLSNDNQRAMRILRDDVKQTIAALPPPPPDPSSSPYAAFRSNDQRVHTSFDAAAWERLASLSEQIAILEEKLGECTRVCVKD